MPDREEAGGRWGTERPSNLLKVTQQSSSKLDQTPSLQMSSLMPCALDHEPFNEATSAGAAGWPTAQGQGLARHPNQPFREALPSASRHTEARSERASQDWWFLEVTLGLSMPSLLASIPKEESSVSRKGPGISRGLWQAEAPKRPGPQRLQSVSVTLWPAGPASLSIHHPRAHSFRLHADPQAQPFMYKREQRGSERGGIGPELHREMVRKAGF